MAKGCKGGLSCDDYKKLIAFRIAEISGRTLYLKKKCDKYMPGSIKKGTQKAIMGHKTEIANKTKALASCIGHAVAKGCCDLPKMPENM